MLAPRPKTAETWALTLGARAADAERLEGWIRSSFGVEPVRIEKPGSARVWIEFYVEGEIRARLAAAAIAGRRGVRGVETRALRPRDWQAFWRHHFPVVRVGRRLRLVPEWKRHRVRPLRGVRDCVIDPGLSFGTGAHFTTRYCLEAMDALCAGSKPPRSLMDIGTGSGILAIAAARLGVPRVTATENDPQALDQARKNARLNRVSRNIRFLQADITRDPPPPAHEMVVANLYGLLLATHAERIAAAARNMIVLSGIRELEADSVAAAFAAYGWLEVERDGNGEWCGLRLEREERRTEGCSEEGNNIRRRAGRTAPESRPAARPEKSPARNRGKPRRTS